MAYDKRDDAVFEVAHAASALAERFTENPLPWHMAEEELIRISDLADKAASERPGFGQISVDLARITSDYSGYRIGDVTASKELLDVVKDVRKEYSSQITYEGVDMADRDEKMRRDLHLPGEKVAVHLREDGSSIIDPSVGLGEGPLTISGTFVRGEQMRIDEDREVLIHHAEYEFEGHEGRHDAWAFQAANGQSQDHGVIMLKDDRMFLVPVERFREDGEAAITGPTREILGGTGRSSYAEVHPAGFAGLKESMTPDGPTVAHKDLTKGPIVGDFTFDTAARGDTTGPILISGIVSASRMIGPEKDDLELATRAVDAFIASERAQDPSLYREGTFALDVRDANRRAPYGLAEVEEAVYVTHSIGRGSIDDPRVAKAMDALVHDPAILGSMLRDAGSTESNLRIVVAVADAPGFVVGASLTPDGMVKWEGVDVMSGEVIPQNANDRAVGVLESVAAAQAAKGSSSARGSILSQASGLSLAPSPVAAKGMGAQETPAAVLSAAVSKGDRGR